jgi:hypothetical protein
VIVAVGADLAQIVKILLVELYSSLMKEVELGMTAGFAVALVVVFVVHWLPFRFAALMLFSFLLLLF